MGGGPLPGWPQRDRLQKRAPVLTRSGASRRRKNLRRCSSRTDGGPREGRRRFVYMVWKRECAGEISRRRPPVARAFIAWRMGRVLICVAPAGVRCFRERGSDGLHHRLTSNTGHAPAGTAESGKVEGRFRQHRSALTRNDRRPGSLGLNACFGTKKWHPLGEPNAYYHEPLFISYA